MIDCHFYHDEHIIISGVYNCLIFIAIFKDSLVASTEKTP